MAEMEGLSGSLIYRICSDLIGFFVGKEEEPLNVGKIGPEELIEKGLIEPAKEEFVWATPNRLAELTLGKDPTHRVVWNKRWYGRIKRKIVRLRHDGAVDSHLLERIEGRN